MQSRIFLEVVRRFSSRKNGGADKSKAILIDNCTWGSLRSEKSAKLINWWRRRNADTLEKASRIGNLTSNGRGQEDAHADALSMVHSAENLMLALSGTVFTKICDDTDASLRSLGFGFPEQNALQRSSGVNIDPLLDNNICCKMFEDTRNYEADIENAQNIGNATGGIFHIPKSDESLNDDQNAVLAAVSDAFSCPLASKLIFAQGHAGCGKSFAVRTIMGLVRAACGSGSVLRATPTGVAAENLAVGAQTIHRAFSIGVYAKNPTMTENEKTKLAKKMQGVRGGQRFNSSGGTFFRFRTFPIISSLEQKKNFLHWS